MKLKHLLFATPLVLSQICEGAVLKFSLQFSNQFGTGVLSNIADETGDTSNGLVWGILVAESGTDFSSPLTDLGLSAVDGAQLAPGYRYFSGGLTTNFTVSLDGGPNAGVISATDTIDATDYNPGVDSGDRFALIWFQRTFAEGGMVSAGTNYGLLTNDTFNLPSDGASDQPYEGEFVGADPLRSATLAVVPEPSTALLAFLSLAGLLRRKR